MPSDVTGVNGGAARVHIPPSAPVRRVLPARAPVPVDGSDASAVRGAHAPLGRSGVSLVDLLFRPDVRERRGAVGGVAMAMGLEQARGLLLRQLPNASLAALDAVWARAQHTEEGWYLRAGALTVLGLPGEADRVAAEALVSRPASCALCLVQSVARALMGDLFGARAALAPALDAAPDDPVLGAQQAAVLAGLGHADEAIGHLDRLSVLHADHPAFRWARSVVHDGPITWWPSPADACEASGDILESAVGRLGARLADMEPDDVVRTARFLMRACSSGGALVSACTPEQAHAARSVLSSLIVVVQGEPGPPSAVTPLVAQLWPLLRGVAEEASAPEHDERGPARRRRDAVRLLRRQGGAVPASVRRLLEVLVVASAGAPHHGTHEGPDDDAEDGAEDGVEVCTDDGAGDGGGASVSVSPEPLAFDRRVAPPDPLIPVRLGLSLLGSREAPLGVAANRPVAVPLLAVPLLAVPLLAVPLLAVPLLAVLLVGGALWLASGRHP